MNTKKIAALIPELWLETVEPWDSETLQEYWDEFGGRVPADVRAFYALTDGGEIPELECRFFGLEEALEIAADMNELRTEMPLIPVFEASGEASDPVCVLLDRGLKGTVVQFCHDGDSRVHATSFYDFLKAISVYDDGCLVASNHTFCFPKKLNKKEKTVVENLIKRSKLGVNPDSECINAEMEPELFAQLAQSMPLATKSKSLDPWSYNNGRARQSAALKLYYKDTPAARATLAEYCKVMNDFAAELVSSFEKEGKKLELEESSGVVKTCFVCYRNRMVSVAEVYSTESGEKRLEPMREWIRGMDKLLDR